MITWLGVQDRELEHWEESPEEFHHQSDSAAFRDNVRPCAELLFATLLQVSLLLLLLPPIHRLHPPAYHGHRVYTPAAAAAAHSPVPHVVSDHWPSWHLSNLSTLYNAACCNAGSRSVCVYVQEACDHP